MSQTLKDKPKNLGLKTIILETLKLQTQNPKNKVVKYTFKNHKSY